MAVFTKWPIGPIDLRAADEPEVGLVHQFGGLEALARRLTGDQERAEAAKIGVDRLEGGVARLRPLAGERVEQEAGLISELPHDVPKISGNRSQLLRKLRCLRGVENQTSGLVAWDFQEPGAST